MTQEPTTGQTVYLFWLKKCNSSRGMTQGPTTGQTVYLFLAQKAQPLPWGDSRATNRKDFTGSRPVKRKISLARALASMSAFAPWRTNGGSRIRPTPNRLLRRVWEPRSAQGKGRGFRRSTRETVKAWCSRAMSFVRSFVAGGRMLGRNRQGLVAGQTLWSCYPSAFEKRERGRRESRPRWTSFGKNL